MKRIDEIDKKVSDDSSRGDISGVDVLNSLLKIVEGTQRDIAFIDITLSGDYEDYNKTYIIK